MIEEGGRGRVKRLVGRVWHGGEIFEGKVYDPFEREKAVSGAMFRVIRWENATLVRGSKAKILHLTEGKRTFG